MSLQIWLPLNGNLKNYGLSDYIVTNNGATIDNNGKIGQCYNFNGTNNYLKITNFNIGNEWSYGCWVYAPTSSRSWEGLIILNNNGGDPDMQLGFYTYPTGTRIQSTANGQYNSGISFTYNQWNHLFATFDGTNLKTYINGLLVNTKAITNSLLPRTNLTIGARCRGTNSYDCYFNGKINDVRIYNHCLSQKEIEEIAKGLILHYKFDDKNLGTTTNLLTLERSLPTSGWNTWAASGQTTPTITYLTGDGVYTKNYMQVLVKSGTTSWRSPYLDDYAITEGEFYAFSAWVKGSSSSIGKTISFSVGANGYTVSNSTSTTITLSSEWQYVTCSAKAVTKTNSSTGRFQWGFGNNNLATSADAIFYVCNLQKENQSYTTSWVRGGTSNTNLTIYDYSGYQNNGTINGNLDYNYNSARYNGALLFNDGTSYISNLNLYSTETKTVACWIKTTKNKSTSQIIFGDSRSELCISFYQGSIIGVFGTTRSTGSKSLLGAEYKENDWNHIVVVKKPTAGQRDIYCNGIKLTPTTDDYWGAVTGLQIGKRNNSSAQPFYGYIADLRLYATELTENQIKELYNTSATIDNLGNIYARELVE